VRGLRAETFTQDGYYYCHLCVRWFGDVVCEGRDACERFPPVLLLTMMLGIRT
jgi:hypothetical protein